MPFSNRMPLALLGVAALVAPMEARAAETTGRIQGTITDTDGLAIPGVVMNITSADLLGAQTAETDANGVYRFVGLPPGDYLVTAEKAAFSKASAQLRVVTGLTARVDLTLKVLVAGEEIVVSEDSPVVDVTSVRQGTVMTKEMIRDIPSAGRDYQGVTDFAPGVVSNGTGNNNMRGGLSYGNQYFVDGINTTDPLTNTFSVNMNYDAIEEVQVITGGFDAEYGRAMGGAVNVVTRSGGNELEGDVQFLYSGTALQVYQPLPEELESNDENGDGKLSADELPQRQDQTLALNLGGPIIKDKVWFFTSVQGNLFTTTPFVPGDVVRPAGEEYEMQSRVWKSAYLFGKVTWRASNAHKLWVHGQTDPTFIDNADTSIYTLPNAEYNWRQGGWLGSVGHQWTPDSKTVVETQVALTSSYLNFRPVGWADCTSDDYDEFGYCSKGATNEFGNWQAFDPDGFSHGTFPYAYHTKRNRQSLTTSATRFFEALGDHQTKLGLQLDMIDSYSAYPGLEEGIEYWGHEGDPTDLAAYSPAQKIVYESNGAATLKGTLISVYLQDAWQPTPRLTIRPGLRLDTSSMLNDLGDKVYSSVTLSPRLGAAYDLTGDGRTRVHAYYGRFYDPGFLEVADLMAGGDNGYSQYSWSAQEGDWSSSPDYTVASTFEVHDDLKTPVSDEFDVGLARDVGDGWLLSSNFTYEHSRNLFEDDEINLIWNEEGTATIGSRDGTGETRYRLRTPDEAFIKYTAIEIAANRMFGEHWGLLSSYTWSHAYGRARDDIGQGLASAAFDIPTLHDEEVGLMPYDVPHNIKMAGSYRDDSVWELGDRTAIGMLFGWNFQASSGFPYQPYYYTDAYGAWYTIKEPIDGSYRLPAYSRTDLKAGVTVAQGRTKWDLTAECFNVFNTRTTTSVATEVNGSDGEIIENDNGTPYFGTPLSKQRPRYFQLGLRGEF